MVHIVVDDDQARIIAQSPERIEVRDRSGRRLGYLTHREVETGVCGDDQQMSLAAREEHFRKCAESLRSYSELPQNWDRYGGHALERKPKEFANSLLNKLQQIPHVPAPVMRPISGGVYLEWRRGDALLAFEADHESVLQFSRSGSAEKVEEYDDFDSERAANAVVDFHEKP